MTAITEITRNGSRSARGLVSIQSRLNQVVDESSSTGKQLIELYKEQNIALFDQNGQLRDSYDILKDLAAVWPNLTRNQQAEFALAQAGANQTQNFTALMDNFQVAIDATATAMDSAGSAMKENSSYMESLEAQTTQLKATFQDFANNVIDKELVSSVLTLANDALGALNTETGSTITQWTLLTGVLTGGIVIYGQIAGKLLSAGSAVITLGKALSAGAATATMFTSAALPLAAAIGAIAVAGWKVYEWYKETHRPLSEYTSQIESNNEQLEKNKERLEEIEKLPWTEKTDEILAEKEALEKQNAELEKNIELNKELQGEAVDRTIGRTVDVYVGKQYGSANLTDARGNIKYFKTYEEALEALNEKYGETIVQEKNLADSIKSTGKYAESTGSILDTNYINILEDLTDELSSNNSLSDDSLELRSKNIDSIKEQVEAYQTAKDRGDDLTSSQERLIDAYNAFIETESQAKEWTEKYGDALVITDEQAQQLIKTFPALKNQLIDTGSGWTILNNNAQTAANGLISADGRIKKSSRDRTKAVLEDLNATITYYGAIAKAFATMGTASGYTATQATQANELARSFDATRKQLEAAIARGVYDDTGVADTPPGTTTTATKKATDLALEEFKNLQKDLEHQRELGLISEEEYYDKLEQLIKDYKAKATAHMKEYGTDVDTINRNMYQYEEEIYKGRAKLADDLAEQQKKDAEEAAQAQKEALEQQKSDYETAINYVIKQIDKEIDKLQDLRDQTEQYYDDKIDALNDANDELERQIQYEQLLNNLAQAKDKQLYVFQNGQFQYVQDVEAIASAQAELDAYKRDEALRKEVENLETLKDQALASIDKQIEGWEKYKEEWEGVTTQYQEQQEKLLAEQVLGIEMEQSNWETRLANVQSFVDQYNSILSQLDSGISAGTSDGNGPSGSSGSAGATSIGGGLSYNPKTGKFYDIAGNVVSGVSTVALTDEQRAAKLAAEEAYELQHTKNVGGFLDDEGYATADDGKTKIKYTSNASGGSKYSIKTASMERRKDLAGQVVKVGRETITYDDNGYAVSKKIDHNAAGTLSAPGGLSLVGERGPELRVLNSGDGIIPADATRNLWDWATYNPKDLMGNMGSDNIFHIGNIALPNVTDAKSFVNGLKQLAYQRAYKRA